ncbi:MAG: pseudouridine synthase [Pseudomonadota bacterium]
MRPPPLDYHPPHAPYLPIAHMDEHVIAVDKPSGLLSVPAKDPKDWDCVEARAEAAFPEAYIIHRLDMDTSGLILLARNKRAQRLLGGQFEKRIIEKQYLAEVWGHPAADHGVIDLPLRADWPNRPLQMVCHEAGKQAITEWRVLERRARTTVMELRPKTGRSHQLRVHMRELGHVIIGDPFYASGEALAAAPRLRLQAQSIRWRCPEDGAWKGVSLPPDF